MTSHQVAHVVLLLTLFCFFNCCASKLFPDWQKTNEILQTEGDALVANMTMSWGQSNILLQSFASNLQQLWSSTNNVIENSINNFTANFASTMKEWNVDFSVQTMKLVGEFQEQWGKSNSLLDLQGTGVQTKWETTNTILDTQFSTMQQAMNEISSRAIDTTVTLVANSTQQVIQIAQEFRETVDKTMTRLADQMAEGTLAFEKTSLALLSNMTQVFYVKADAFLVNVTKLGIVGCFGILVLWYLKDHFLREWLLLLYSFATSIVTLTPIIPNLFGSDIGKVVNVIVNLWLLVQSTSLLTKVVKNIWFEPVVDTTAKREERLPLRSTNNSSVSTMEEVRIEEALQEDSWYRKAMLKAQIVQLLGLAAVSLYSVIVIVVLVSIRNT